VDTEDQADQEAPEDQRRIIQLEHQADQKDLAVLEDSEDQEDQADPADQVSHREVICKCKLVAGVPGYEGVPTSELPTGVPGGPGGPGGPDGPGGPGMTINVKRGFKSILFRWTRRPRRQT
jgi:hypothetical protein